MACTFWYCKRSYTLMIEIIYSSKNFVVLKYKEKYYCYSYCKLIAEKYGIFFTIHKLKIETQKNKYADIQGLKNPSKQEEIEQLNREASLLNWDLGAQAAGMLVQDQYSSSSKWGTPISKFPIWNDQKIFYNQLI